MADINKTIEIIFGAVDNTGSALNSVADGLQTLDGKIHDVTGPLSDLGDALVKTETAVLAMGAAFVGVAINQAGKFQASINEIGTLFGGTQDQISAFSDSVLDYATNSTASLDDITSATYSAVSAGIDYTKSLEFLNAAEQLSVAGKADLNATVQVLASSLNAYGASTDQAAHYANILFTTVKDGQVTLPELAASLSQVTAIASAAGIPFDTLNAAIAALTAYGVKPAQAMTSLAQAINSILSPSTQATELAGQLGLNFNLAGLNADGLAGFLAKVQDATGGSAEKMITLFGSVEAFKAVAFLAKDAAGSFANSLNDMANNAGTVSAAFDLMKNNLNLINQNIVNNLQAVLIGVGSKLLNEYGDAGSALADIFKGLKIGLDAGAFDPVFDAINAFGADAATYFEGIAKALPDALKGLNFDALLASFGELGDTIAGLFGNLDLTNSDDLRKAIQTVIDTIASLTTTTGGLIQQWVNLIDKFKPLISGFLELDGDTKSSIGGLLGLSQEYEKFRFIIEPLTSVLNLLGSGFQSLAGILVAGALLKNLGILNTTLSGIAATLSGAGLVSVIGALIIALGNWEKSNGGLLPSVAKLSSDLVLWAKGVTDVKEKTIEVPPVVDALGNSIDQYSDKARTAAQATDLTVQSTKGIEAQFNAALSPISAFTDQLLKYSGAVNQSHTELAGFNKEVVDGVTTYSKAGEQVGIISTKFKESGNSAEEAAKKSDEYLIKMQQIASDERIAVIKGTFELNIAALEAQAKQAVAIIETIGTEITSTGDVLKTLFTLLADFDSLSWTASDLITSQIKFENAIRQQAANDAHNLAQTEIDLKKAQLDSLRNGTPLFQVNADGVEPELRQLLFKLLQLIQVEASGSYGNFLLALG